MGGIRCAKEIIDNGNAVTQQLGCMNASILLAAINGVEPTYEEAKAFRAAADALCLVASGIEKRVREGG